MMTREQQQLVIDHLKIAKSLAAHRTNMNCPGLSFEDLYQEGCRLLCIAAMHYDGHTASFSTYANKVVVNGLHTYCSRMAKKDRVEIPVEDDALEFYLGVEQYSAKTNQLLEFRDLCRQTQQRYSGGAYWGIRALILEAEGYSFQEVSRMLHIKSNLLGAMISRAKYKLRKDHQFISDIQN